MRKLFSVLSSTLQGGVRRGLLLLALFASVSAIYASNTKVGGIWYDFDSSTKTASVTYRGNYSSSYEGEYSGSVTIPETITYNGTTYSVTSIGSSAFSGCSSLTSVTIPNSVTSIGGYAFNGCSSLTSVTIGNSVTSIGNFAFEDCSSLTSVTIGNSVTSIGSSAFRNCSSLTSVTIPNSVTSIGNSAFYSCSSLTSVTIGNSVKSIGEDAFYGCSSLTSVTIGNSVKSIGEDAFIYCSSLTKTNYTGDIAGWCNIKFGGGGANPMCYSHNFYINDQEIKDLVIPNSVTSIGNYAFYSCSKLTSVTIGESVTSIGEGAFYYCYRLTKTNYTGDIAGWCNIKFSTTTSNPMCYSHNFYINDQEIKDLVIPNSVTSIGGGAFYSCSELTSVTIGESVTSIGNYAFYSCSKLTSITIPNNVTRIGNYTFYSCSKLTSITCEATTPPTIGSSAFEGVSISIPVYVPCECVEAYKAANGWEDFSNIQEPLAEYSIEVYANDTIMGSAKVDWNRACDTQISATPNFGYQFVHWNDGNTDNPRSFVITQDSILTAEFAPNTYTITTVSSDTQRGTTQGDTTVNYLEYITISASASYGYHFVQWNDGNSDNPRQVLVTGDTTYTATFDKNTYAISLSCNEEQGSVEGVTSAKYLDTVTISATPNIGYHFVQWSDGNTDAIRTLELTQDTILTAEFAQSFSGQCGDDLYWNYDETAKTISITGSGKMYDYTADIQPWLLFKEQIVEVTTTNTVTSIGTSAFEGCIRLSKISLGTGLEEIAANAFAGCTRLYDIYVYATYPPFADESSFANYNVYVYIPCEYQRDYILDVVWGKFKFIECIDSEEATTDGNVTVVPGFNDVTITWPTESNADTYTIVIKKDGEVFCTLTFNAVGQLLNIAFAPSRNGDHRPVQYAEQAINGFTFTITGLDEGSVYTYDLVVKDRGNNIIQFYSGEFRTWSVYDRTVKVEYDAKQGKVTGAGRYLLGETATLTAIPNEGYRFVRWEDGSTDNPRTLVIEQDTSLVAYFEIIYLQPDSVTLCYGETYQWHDKTYDASGVYVDTLSNGVATLYLTILPQVEETIEEATICYGETYTWQADGKVYAESGIYSVTLQDINGCDSVVILHLTVNPVATTEETIIACYSYEWNNQTYTQSGEYTYTTTAANGCDSVVTLHLIINNTQYAEEYVVACDSYTWNGETYTTSGEYVYTTTATNGCDSIVTLHLTILPDATTESETLALCPSELPYEWYGQSLTEEGTYSATEQYAGMECDSVIHELTLNVYVQTLPAAVTLPIVRTGGAIDVTIPTAEIQAHIAAETWYAPNALVVWYIMENSDWVALSAESVATGITEVTLKYVVDTDCGNVESDKMVIAVETTDVENTQSQSPTSNCRKILYEDYIYILREGKVYSVMGHEL